MHVPSLQPPATCRQSTIHTASRSKTSTAFACVHCCNSFAAPRLPSPWLPSPWLPVWCTHASPPSQSQLLRVAVWQSHVPHALPWVRNSGRSGWLHPHQRVTPIHHQTGNRYFKITRVDCSILLSVTNLRVSLYTLKPTWCPQPRPWWRP